MMKNYTVDETMLRFLDSLVEKASEKLWMLDLIDFDNNPGQAAQEDVTYENITDSQGRDSMEPSVSQNSDITNTGTGDVPGFLKYAKNSGSKGDGGGLSTVKNDITLSHKENRKDVTGAIQDLPSVGSQSSIQSAKHSVNTKGNQRKKPKKVRKSGKKSKQIGVKGNLQKQDSMSQTHTHNSQNSGTLSQGKPMTKQGPSKQQLEEIQQNIRAGNIILPSNMNGNKENKPEKHVYVRNKRDSDAVLYHHNMMRKTKKEPELEDYQGEVYSFN